MPTIIDLSNLGSAGFALEGDASEDHAGTSVSDAGDVNGDGFDDVIVGAKGADDGGENAGEAYVIYGKAGGLSRVDLGNLTPDVGFTVRGASPGASAGEAVSSAGDVNGDGYDDILVGGPWGHIVYLIFGRGDPIGTINVGSLRASDGVAIRGEEGEGFFGHGVAGAGDINGDGFEDIILSTPTGDNSPFTTYGGYGEAYVVFGKADGWSAIDVSTLDSTHPDHDPADGFLIRAGSSANDGAGFSVGGGGDFNGDGFADLIVGAPFGNGGSGGAFVLFGTAEQSDGIDLSALDPEEGFFIKGAKMNTGYAVSLAGDVNGDGFDDVIVGAPWGTDPSDGGFAGGQTFVVFGKADGFGTVDLGNLGAGGFKILADAGGDLLGWSVATAGDVNADGFDDIIVGAPYNDDGGFAAGAAYVIYGKAGGFATIDVTDLAPADGFVIQGEDLDTAGSSVSSAGDINGDGFADLIVGSPTGDDAAVDAGEAYVIFGVAPTAAVTRTGSAGGQTIRGGAFADTLRGLGGNDELIGSGGNDLLDGGSGIDIMRGGAGNDKYVVDNVGDRVIDSVGGGTDLVTSSVSFTLAANVENLTLGGASATKGTGNSLANILTGNGAANQLDGRGGSDTMAGGNGNDTYAVDNAGDKVVETGTGGVDEVQSSISYALGAYLENLTLTGSGAINGTGNALGNNLSGNGAGNVLNGGAGADSMAGGIGDDTYVVDNVGDKVVEASASGGTDTVQSSISQTLGASVENLKLTGTSNLAGTGNVLANVLTGNGSGNRLDGVDGADSLYGGGGVDTMLGGGGDDRLIGGAGSDRLGGGAGKDRFYFEAALGSTNVDRISDFSAADDTLLLDRDIFTGISANGILAASAFRAGTAALDASDRILYDSATGNIRYDPDGSGGAGSILFLQVAPGTALTNTDFVGYI